MKPKHLIDEFKDVIAKYLGHYSLLKTEYSPRNAICVTISTTAPPNSSNTLPRDEVISVLQSLFTHPIPVLPDPVVNTDPSDQVQSVLGQEHPGLILDCSESWPDNALGAAAGCIKAPGTLFMLMPSGLDIPVSATPYEIHIKRCCREFFSPVPQHPGLWSISSLNSAEADTHQSNEAAELQRLGFESQNEVVTALHNRCLSQERTTDLLLSRRGRGKSATLGLLVKRMNSTGAAERSQQITLTSPHKNQVSTVLEYAQEDTLTHTPLQVAMQSGGDVLIVDEAGSVPLPVLRLLNKNYKHTIFAGTVDGYEGSGRALAIRLAEPDPTQGHMPTNVRTHTLTQPIRWPANDPLEALAEHILRLGIVAPSAALTTDVRCDDPIVPEAVHYQIVSSNQLLENTNLLDEIFSLLFQAHYQTTSKDLKHLLNQQKMMLWTQTHNGVLTGACLVACEGGLSEELQLGIQQGTRRPAHQKLPMLLYRQCHADSVLSSRHWRIVRIAIKPAWQRKGLGQLFLSALAERAKQRALSGGTSVDYIGASFGATQDAYRFWLNAGFSAVHWGFKLNPRSGQRALTVAKAVHNNCALERAHQNFIDSIGTLQALRRLKPEWLNVLYNDKLFDDALIDALVQTARCKAESAAMHSQSDDSHRLTLWRNNQLGLHDLWGPVARSFHGVDKLVQLELSDAATEKQIAKTLKAAVFA